MSAIFEAITPVYTLILSFFGQVVSTITGNPLMFVPVLLSLAAGLIMFAVGIVRRMGVKGIGSGGRRRRGR